MQFTTIFALAAAMAGTTLASPATSHHAERELAQRAVHESIGKSLLERNLFQKRDCDCAALKQCNPNCAAGFGLNPVGQGACVLTCADAAGCGSDETCLCCADGTSQPEATNCANNGGVTDCS